MRNKILLILLSIFFLFGCSSKPSAEDGWEQNDEDPDIYSREKKYAQDSSNTKDFLNAYEGTWVSDEFDNVVVIFENDEIRIGVHSKSYVFPVSSYSLKTNEIATKGNNYESFVSTYDLNLAVPPLYNEYMKEILIFATTLQPNIIKSSNHALTLRVGGEGNYAFYNLKQSDKEYIRALDPVIQEAKQVAVAAIEAEEPDTSGIGMPYIYLNDNKFYLDENGNLKITGYYNNVDISTVHWYIGDKNLGIAEETGTDDMEFVLSLVNEGPPIAVEESVTLKAIDRKKESIVYLTKEITIDTSKFIPETKKNEISKKNEYEDSASNNADSIENNETADTELNEHEELANNSTEGSEHDTDIEKAINILSEYFTDTMEISYFEENFEVVPTSSDFSSIVVYPEFARSEPSKEWLEIRSSLLSASERISKETSLHTPHILFILDITSLLLVELSDGEIIFDATIE